MERALVSFQHRVTRRIAGRNPRSLGKGGWDYTAIAAAMKEAGFEEIGVYIKMRQNMAAQYIAT